MLRHRRLARNFGNNIWLARDELIERLHDVDAGKFCACDVAPPGSGERADDVHAAVCSGGAQRSDDVLRHAAAADKPDRCHRPITAG